MKECEIFLGKHETNMFRTESVKDEHAPTGSMNLDGLRIKE